MAGLVDDNREDVLEQAVQRFVDAQLSGQEPEVDAFARQHPHCEEQLKKRLQSLKQVDALLTDLTQADASDFEETVTGHDLVGRKIGNFEIEDMIGRGGMGVVYLARDTKLKRSVAIKSMPGELQADSTARTRFRREAELLASLNHPNIAVIYDIVEQEDGAGYLILEYVPGESLAQRVAREPVKLEEALAIAQQVAEAISAAHDKGVIHRDLKPGNIKITPEGKVKVLDFGLAKVSGGKAGSGEITVTQPGRVIGTPAYMSPEQARGKPTDKRSDIWSFGCIIYQMLTGHLPFEGETATDTVARILEREPDWEALPQEIPMNIRTLLRRCLEKKPQRRLQHIGDAVIEINETLNMPVTAPPVTTPSSTSLTPQITARRKLRTAAMIAAVFAIVLTVIAVQLISKKAVQPSSKEIRLVVLPFENLGSTEDEYFADGITEEIMSRLSAIQALGVISRTSAMQYKNSNKTIRQIGQELGVKYVLEGTVRSERPSEGPSRVRVTPQLIRVPDDTHVWSDRYDAVLADIFQVQSDIAEQVAQALDITLLQSERRALASRPTENVEAYEYYLRGSEYFHRYELRIAIGMYEKAIEIDPTFAVAYAKLSEVHASMYHSYRDRSEERLAKAKETVDKAFQLDPALPEAHLALGRYYDGCLDNDRALEQFTIARKSRPHNNEIIARIGYAQRRQGKFEEAVTNFKKVWELDPLSFSLPGQLGETLVRLRRYSEAERYFNRAISLAPDRLGPYVNKSFIYVYRDGNTEKARAVLAEALQNIKSTGESRRIRHFFVRLNVLARDYQEALDRTSIESEGRDDARCFVPNSLQCAQIYMYMDKKELAKEHYDDARSILESKIKEQPEDERFHSSLGIVYAGLGRKEEAVREGKLAVEMLPVSKDAMSGPDRLENLARIYVMVGEFDAAIDQLEFLLSIPDDTSIPLFRLDPAWDPLRDHPRFKKLLRAGK